jgi:predicted nucleotidyltransferase
VGPTIFNRTDLLQRLSEHSPEIKTFGVSQLGLFGSFARDTKVTSESDVDFLVDFESGKKTYDNFIELSFFLEDLLGRKVDLVTPQSLSKYIGPHILKEVQHVPLP